MKKCKRYSVLLAGLVFLLGGSVGTCVPAPGSGPPVIVEFTTTPTEINAGESATLLWNVTGATSVSIDQGIGNVPAAGVKEVSPATTTGYTLTAANTVGTVTRSVVITVAAPPTDSEPPIITKILVSSITETTAVITWTTDESATSQVEYGTTTAYGSSSALDVALVTSHSAALTGLEEDTTYHFVVKSKDATGNETKSEDKTFTTSSEAGTLPIIHSFEASPLSITAGSSATLSWDVSDATSVTIDPGVGTFASSGTTLVLPALTTLYTLTATNEDGSIIATIEVMVTADVTLTLHVHEGNISGSLLSGVQVTGQDGDGNIFNQTTNSSGYVTITGIPGTWSFTASKSGYQTNSWSQSITTTDTKHAYLAAESPPPTLPPGMGAFKGQVRWGDKPLIHGTVIADTKHPAVVVPPWESYSAKYKQFSIEPDNQGNYLLLVEPGDYYIGCSMPGSAYISYQTLGSDLFGVSSYQVAIGEVVTVDLLALDWSIELVSPGDTDYDTDSTITQNPPTLVWKEYDWAKYGEVGYYQVELGIYEDGYHTVMKGKTESTSYAVPNPLKAGKYKWEVRAYTKTDKEIAGCVDEFFFLAP